MEVARQKISDLCDVLMNDKLNNRRNYYRILHVQADAPLAVIKASYKTIMHKMKAHPDLGGDTANAALINEAYNILSDPEKRAHYDRINKPFYKQSGQKKSAADATNSQHTEQNQHINQEQDRFACPFCSAVNIIKRDSLKGARCFKCHNVLLGSMQSDQAAACKRNIARMHKEGRILVYLPDQQKPIRAIVNDLSPEGMSFITDIQLQEKSLVKIESEIINAAAKVVSCNRYRFSTNNIYGFSIRKAYTIGVRFVTVDFFSKHGTFISEKT
jgi:curved DNA-binding protein CbpA